MTTDATPGNVLLSDLSGLVPERDPLPRVPPLPFAVFDEFGVGVNDRVHAYAIVHAAAAQAAERERCAKLCEQKARSRWAWWDSRADPADQGAAMAADELADEIREPSGG